MSVLKDGLDYLNANPGQVTILAALLAVALQYAVNKIKELGELTNYTLALIALPGFTTGALAYATNLHLTAYPSVVLLGQLVYAVLEAYKKRVVASATPALSQVQTATVTPASVVNVPVTEEY